MTRRDRPRMPTKLPFLTLVLLISFASVNAVLFTPALPAIAQFFNVTHASAQATISWFLVGYALGQLLYGPVANRFGRKPALYMGIGVQIFSSVLCALAGTLQHFEWLVVARFLCALGSGVGVSMTFTMVNECYATKIAAQKIAYLLLAFAVTPALSVAIGGFLNSYLGWMSCFYASAVYGLVLCLLVMRLPETRIHKNPHALKIPHLLRAYACQLTNPRLILGGLLMGLCGCFLYVFAALGPFVAIQLFGMRSADYGTANLLPSIGLLLGSLVGARLVRYYSLTTLIALGIGLAMLGTLILWLTIDRPMSIIFALFMPMILIYFGLCFIIGNASTFAMSHTKDKAHGSALMSFINIGSSTLAVGSLGFFSVNAHLLPLLYSVLCFSMLVMWICIGRVGR